MNTAILIPYSTQELDLEEYEFDDTYIGPLDEELDEYDIQSQISTISDTQENQVILDAQKIQLIAQSPNDSIAMSDSTTKN
ncbi:45852_t:CDS:2, partial [Gigaspora margarita]